MPKPICTSAYIASFTFGAGFMAIALLHPASGIGDLGVKHLVLLAAYLGFIAFAAYMQHTMGLQITDAAYGSPQKFIASGLFNWSRNPIYLAFLVPLAALGQWSVAISLITIVVYLALMQKTVVRREEADLERTFGETYASYKARVPRWLRVPGYRAF